jgi:hypothetical protein
LSYSTRLSRLIPKLFTVVGPNIKPSIHTVRLHTNITTFFKLKKFCSEIQPINNQFKT